MNYPISDFSLKGHAVWFFHWRKPQFYLVGYEVVTALPLYIYIYISHFIFG